MDYDAELAKCEKVVSEYVEKFVQAGEALASIQKDRLYRNHYGSFTAYLDGNRWGMDKSTAHRLINAAEAYRNVANSATSQEPVGEYQVRPLTGLTPEQQVKVWELAVQKAGKGKVTAKLVKEAKQEKPWLGKEGTKEDSPSADEIANSILEEDAQSQSGLPYVQVIMDREKPYGWDDSDSEIHRAVWMGDHQLISSLLAQGTPANEMDTCGVTPIDLAIYRHDDGALGILCPDGTTVEDGVLEAAITCGNSKAFEFLLRRLAPRNGHAEGLELAVKAGRLDYVKKLVESGRWKVEELAALLPDMPVSLLEDALDFLCDSLDQRKVNRLLVEPFVTAANQGKLRRARHINRRMTEAPHPIEAVRKTQPQEDESTIDLEASICALSHEYEVKGAEHKQKDGQIERRAAKLEKDRQALEQEKAGLDEVRRRLVQMAEALVLSKADDDS